MDCGTTPRADSITLGTVDSLGLWSDTSVVGRDGAEPCGGIKPFRTKEQAEKAREKYPERLRKGIGLGVIRIKR